MDKAEASPPQRPRSSSRPFLLLLAAPFLYGIPQASAQTPADRVEALAESASGFQLLGNITTGVLAAGQTQGLVLPMYEGSDYMVVAFCGPGCGNLDLALLDPAGTEVAADRLPDAEPIVTYSPSIMGRFSIQADMVDCATGRCQFAIGILGSSSERGVPPGEDMGTRLSLFASDMEARGFAEIGIPRRGSLATDQAVRLPLELLGGVEYRIVGVCDIDCYDMDFILWDSAQNQVATDFLEDPVPVLAVAPQVQSTYELEVGMVYCEIEPCGFQVAIYGKGEDLGSEDAPFSGTLHSFDTHEGELAEGDQTMDGVFLDPYEVQVRAGQRIIVDLRSEAFDTLVRILDPAGQMEETLDSAAETGHSYVEILAPTDGTYTVQATSITPGAQGEYVLQIAVVG